MRMLDLIEIDLVAGGSKKSIGSRPVSASIHHAQAHKKAHPAKAKAQHVKSAGKTMATIRPADEGDGDGDGDGGDGSEGGDGDGDGDGDTGDGALSGSAPGSNTNPANLATVKVTGTTASGLPITQVTYTDSAGNVSVVVGTHPNRDNNPLDIRYGAFAVAHGALANDGGFAVFPSPEAGTNAASALMSQYNTQFFNGDGTLSQIITKWSPPSENNTAAMIAAIPTNAGLTASTTWPSMSAAQQTSFVQAYAKYEGWN